jgi:hypothetical protein
VKTRLLDYVVMAFGFYVATYMAWLAKWWVAVAVGLVVVYQGSLVRRRHVRQGVTQNDQPDDVSLKE